MDTHLGKLSQEGKDELCEWIQTNDLLLSFDQTADIQEMPASFDGWRRYISGDVTTTMKILKFRSKLEVVK